MHFRLATWLAAFAIGVVAMPFAASAQPPTSQSAPGQAKKYRATSPIVVDKATGERRMPTEQEVATLVTTLSALTATNPSPVVETGAGGVMSARIEGMDGVFLGRATEEGTIETRCVFSFEEGMSFLGLVPVVE